MAPVLPAGTDRTVVIVLIVLLSAFPLAVIGCCWLRFSCRRHGKCTRCRARHRAGARCPNGGVRRGWTGARSRAIMREAARRADEAERARSARQQAIRERWRAERERRTHERAVAHARAAERAEHRRIEAMPPLPVYTVDAPAFDIVIIPADRPELGRVPSYASACPSYKTECAPQAPPGSLDFAAGSLDALRAALARPFARPAPVLPIAMTELEPAAPQLARTRSKDSLRTLRRGSWASEASHPESESA